MKLKQLMLAPVAMGMIAPAAATAADLNLAAVNQYSSDQVTSITQFSDVKPTDWAYQALNNLVERYGCVAGYPNGTFAGSQAMTRFEAAALLNSCLDRVSEVTDEIQRLLKEFSGELAVLRGRVSGLEKKVATLESTQFSTTTKLKGEANFVLGGVPGLETVSGKTVKNVGNTAFNYDLRLNFDTSFTGKDLLRTRLRAGNFADNPFGSSSSLYKLDKAETTANGVIIDRLYYQAPINKNLVATIGPLVRNTEINWIPSAYKSEILDFFQNAGTPGVYNKATGAGGGLMWKSPGKNGGVVASLSYIAQNGADSSTGVFNAGGALNTLLQLGYRAPQWGLAFGYRNGTEGSRVRNFNALGGGSGVLGAGQGSNGYAVNAYWQPNKSGIVPSISAGYGWNTVSGRGPVTGATNSQTWMVGLQWSDVFAKGNGAGVAVGQPGNSTNISADATMWELFYKYRVSDNVSITPALFYVSNNQRFAGQSELGGVIQTKFTF